MGTISKLLASRAIVWGLCFGVGLLVFPGVSKGWILVLSGVAIFGTAFVRRRIGKMASRALSRGKVASARRSYRLLLWTSFGRDAKRSCQVSLAACSAVNEDYKACLATLAGLPQAKANNEALRAVILNLHAYCDARLGHHLKEALDRAQEAVALRPQVRGFLHTRGLLHLAQGNRNEALRDFESAFPGGSKGEVLSLLEAERCFDLGRLWKGGGHNDYADDYFSRSIMAAPASKWAKRSRQEVDSSPTRDTFDFAL